MMRSPAHRRVRVVAVHRDSVRVDGVAASRPVVIARVMHVVTDDADRPVMTAHVDPHWHGVRPPRAVSGQLESADSDVARRADLDQRGEVSGRRQPASVEHWLLVSVRPNGQVRDARQPKSLVIRASAQFYDAAGPLQPAHGHLHRPHRVCRCAGVRGQSRAVRPR